MNFKNIIVEIGIIIWYNLIYGPIGNKFLFISKSFLKGADYGIQIALKIRANSSIIAKKLSISYPIPSIPPLNNQSQILPENANLLFLNLSFLFFTLALAVKMPAWRSNQGFSLKMPGVTVYGQRPRPCIAVRLPRRGPKFPGPYFKTFWVMP